MSIACLLFTGSFEKKKKKKDNLYVLKTAFWINALRWFHPSPQLLRVCLGMWLPVIFYIVKERKELACKGTDKAGLTLRGHGWSGNENQRQQEKLLERLRWKRCQVRGAKPAMGKCVPGQEWDQCGLSPLTMGHQSPLKGSDTQSHLCFKRISAPFCFLGLNTTGAGSGWMSIRGRRMERGKRISWGCCGSKSQSSGQWPLLERR